MTRLKANSILILMTIIWGASFIFMKNTLQFVSPLVFSTLRLAVAALSLAIIFYKKLPLLLNKKILLYCFVLGVLNVCVVFFQITGLRFTSASNSAFITSFSVLLVPFFSAMILKKRPKKNSVIGVLIAFLGLFYITGGIDTALNIGDFYTFLCATAIALHMVLIALFIKKEDGFLLSVGQTIAAEVILIFICVIMSEPVLTTVTINRQLVLCVLYAGVICTAFNNTAQIYVQKYINPISVALILLLEPVFALLFALFFKGPNGTTEVLTLFKVVGSILIISGAVFSELDPIDKFFAFLKSKNQNKKMNGGNTYEESLK
ncbi:MAG: DMT family transporter [Clostridiales bacterium]|nr:DMT family transporter [Clostridiales bacterium]